MKKNKQEKAPKPPRKKRGFRWLCYRFFKRTFDIFASGLFIILFSWLYLILAVVVKCSDGGNVFYRHERVGKNGKTIYLPKFRSMKKDADKLEDMLTPEQLAAREDARRREEGDLYGADLRRRSPSAHAGGDRGKVRGG